MNSKPNAWLPTGKRITMHHSRSELALSRRSGYIPNMSYQSITATALQARLGEEDAPLLIDVREPIEYEIARVAGAQLLPMSRFYEWAGTLDTQREIVVMCHHGIRSAQVCYALAQSGYTKLFNLTGGIAAWSAEVDHNVPQY